MRYAFAHRGGSHGPDNALPTFAEALARGATGLESDAWLSRDGEVVLDHDGYADRRRRVRIADLDREHLPGHLTTLEELYGRCGTDFDLAVDVKAEPVAAALDAAAVRHAAADRLWVVAPDPAQLEPVAAAHRALTVRAAPLRSRSRSQLFDGARNAGVEAINARWIWWTRSIIAEVHGRGMLAFGYDAQHVWSLRRCAALGLDGVFSNHVDRMVAAVGPARD